MDQETVNKRSRRNFGGMVFRGENCKELDMSRCNFNRAILTGANLSYTDLSNSSFFHADLINADLSSAWVEGTNFQNANLTRANLQNVNMLPAFWRDARMEDILRLDADEQALLNPEGYISTAPYRIQDLAKITRGYLEKHGSLPRSNKLYSMGYMGCYIVLIWDSHIEIGCKQYLPEHIDAMDDETADELGGVIALRWWREYGVIIQAMNDRFCIKRGVAK